MAKDYAQFVSLVVKIVGVRRELGQRIKLNFTVSFRFPKRIEVFETGYTSVVLEAGLVLL